jgi:hypothetical protein
MATASSVHIYNRVSSTAQKDGYSLDDQERACRSWAPSVGSPSHRWSGRCGRARTGTAPSSTPCLTGSGRETHFSPTTRIDLVAAERSTRSSSSTVSRRPARSFNSLPGISTGASGGR